MIGLQANHTAFPYATIEQAVNDAPAHALVRIMINPGYGIFRQRRNTGALPAGITLILNTLAGNHGKLVAGRSDLDFGNSDQIFDATDHQVR